jgi:outer membrane protein
MKQESKNSSPIHSMALNPKLTLIVSVIALVFSVIAFISPLHKPKIGYVRSAELIYGYIGMKEAQNRYQEKLQVWQVNLDTLKADYQKALSRFGTDRPNLSKAERGQWEERLKMQETHLAKYSAAIDNQAKQEDQKITQGVLNQINSFIEDYGRRKGYDIILGTTLSGNILFGIEAMDITEEVLEELNKSYYTGGRNNLNLDESFANEEP